MAQVTVDIYGRLHKRSLDRTVGDLQREMQSAGRQSGEAFGNEFAHGVQRSAPRVQAAMVGVANATERLRIQQEKYNEALRSNDFDKVAAQADKLTRAYKSHDSAIRNVQQAYGEFDKATDVASNSTSALTRNMSQLGGAVGALGKIGTPAAIVGIGGALVEVAGIAASAAQSLWLLPAAAAAAGAGIGTLKLATAGFSDAMENLRDPEAFAEALQQLSPNAQRAARDIQAMLPAFDSLKSATQDALFAGIGPQLTTLANQYLPAVQQMTTGIASSFGSMFSGVANQLMTPETFGAVKETIDNIVAAFQNLAPAAAPLTQALAEITKVGSGFLPELAAAASDAAQAFADFIAQASQSGDLQRWLSEGLDTLGLLGEAVWKLGEGFMALAPVGQAILPDIVALLENINDLMPVIGAAAMLVGPSIGTWVTAADNAANAINAMKGVFEGLANFAVEHINRIGQALNALTGPIRSVAGLAGINIPTFTAVNPVNLTGPGGGGAYLPKGGGGSLPPAYGLPATAPSGPWESLSPADRWLRADAAANPSAGPVGTPGTYRRRDGSIGFTATPSITGERPAPLAGPYASGGGGGGSATSDLPVLPYNAKDPMSLLQGYPVTSSLYGAAGSVLDAQQRRAQAESDLNELLKSNVATANEIQNARNDLAKAEREQHEAEIRLQEAKASATEKFTNRVDDLNSGISELSAGLDKDLGLSNGLAGLADNLVRFLGAIATAPLQAQLQRQIQANPNEGSGLIGIAAAQGAFGPQYTPQAIAAASNPTTSYGGYGMPQYGGYPAYASSPSFAAQPGQSARSFAHEVMMPYWQSMGLTVGDHAADQHGEHQNGALDIMVDSIEQGNAVLAQVLQDPNVYGAIFNRQSYGYGNGASPRAYNGASPHTDHVHAWYKPGGQNNIAPRQYGGAPNWSQGMPLPNLPIGAGGGESPVLGNGPMGPGIGAGYQPTVQPQAPQGWQPGAKSSGGGGIIGAAGSAAAGMFPGGGAAAQIAMQMIQRTIQYGGEVAGSLAQGALDFFSVSDPDGGPGASLGESWLGRLAGSIASASPQLPSTAGGADKATEQGRQQQQSGAAAQAVNGGKPSHGLNIENMTVQADQMEGQKMAAQLAYASAAAGMYGG